MSLLTMQSKRVMASPATNAIPQKKTTFVLYESKDKFASDTISKISKTFDCCFEHSYLVASQLADDDNPSSLLDRIIIQLRDKAINSRFITEITKENISFCRKLIKISEVRHIDSLIGNFSICDGTEYLGHIINGGKEQTTNEVNEDSVHGNLQHQQRHFLVHTNNESFVEMQQFLFDVLWSKAIPAKERIIQIERTEITDLKEAIKEPKEIQKLAFRLLGSAIYEILVIFPAISAFQWAERDGILNLLKEALERDVNIKALIYTGNEGGDSDETLIQIPQIKLKEKNLQGNVNFVHKPIQTQDITIVVDQAVFFSIEIDRDAKEQSLILKATISNNESAVSFSVSMFESLWIQSEFEKQNKIKQAYFQMFKGIKLKDETYKKQWSFEDTIGDSNSIS